MLIKLHEYDTRLVDMATKVLCSYRDIDESLASSYRKFGQPPTQQRAENLVKQYGRWNQVADYVMPYEELLSNKPGILKGLAMALDIQNYDSQAILEELDQLGYMSKGPKNDIYHEVNLFHRGHRTTSTPSVLR